MREERLGNVGGLSRPARQRILQPDELRTDLEEPAGIDDRGWGEVLAALAIARGTMTRAELVRSRRKRVSLDD